MKARCSNQTVTEHGGGMRVRKCLDGEGEFVEGSFLWFGMNTSRGQSLQRTL